MTPFEDLIRELSFVMNVDLFPDSHQSCTISFLPEDISIQVDLDTNADKILIGIQLGRITPGSYRERIFSAALQANGCTKFPQGILSFSEKNDTLVLFQFLPLNHLTGERLYSFLQRFRDHALVWQEALKRGDIPQMSAGSSSENIFGLKR